MKIICSDYDGTLNHGGITEKKLAAIKKWQAAGNLFCIVSGRQKEFFSQLVSSNIPFDYLLACNGAVICDKNESIVCDVRCRADIAGRLIEFIFSLGCSFVFFCADSSFRIKNKDFPDEDGEELDPGRHYGSFNQISTACRDFDEAARVCEEIRKAFGKYVNPLQNGTCIDIVSARFDKAQGIYRLLELTGAEKKDVIAVGDNVNDEAMIREFYSYAMENGVDSVKALADRVTVGIEEITERELSL